MLFLCLSNFPLLCIVLSTYVRMCMCTYVVFEVLLIFDALMVPFRNDIQKITYRRKKFLIEIRADKVCMCVLVCVSVYASAVCTYIRTY